MGNVPRKADGRRVFNVEFKRTTVQRILTCEKTIAELSRELDIAPTAFWSSQHAEDQKANDNQLHGDR